uniref:Uncharacterized protein n=1 Tax=Pundamilia nyererei TaxID=303518 RepID=A0A3B4H1P4_9CICH
MTRSRKRRHLPFTIQYIGEIILRLAVGNGIRADVWRDFVRRFGEIQISEFYASTEGKFALMKQCVNKGEHLRDSYGFFIEVEKGEPGLLVTEITAKAPFIGYVRDMKQTEKKKLHNVFKKGDLYFNTGDLLRIDEDNFMYFHDSLKTKNVNKWKGENVATAEVADILVLADCVKEATVHGVKVPGTCCFVAALAPKPRNICSNQNYDKPPCLFLAIQENCTIYLISICHGSVLADHVERGGGPKCRHLYQIYDLTKSEPFIDG